MQVANLLEFKKNLFVFHEDNMDQYTNKDCREISALTKY